MGKNVTIMILMLAGLTGSSAYAGKALADRLEDQYFAALDGWVEQGGRVDEYQKIVVETCGKLVLATASTSEALAFTTTSREQFDFRVDVCTKTTVHRVHHQPEFDDPKILQTICDDSSVSLFKKLCKRSGLR